jgi:cyclase
VNEIAEYVGNQSVVVVLDVKKNFISGKYEVLTHNGQKKTGKCPVEFSQQLERLGVGEIVINSIDNDGIQKGYDFVLADKIRESISVPMTMLGGAGSLKDIGGLISKYGIIGAAAGSLFVFKGIYKAVLISYPSRDQKDALIKENYRIFCNSAKSGISMKNTFRVNDSGKNGSCLTGQAGTY